MGNVEFVKGYIEEIPLADGSVDVVNSNRALNLSADKPTVFHEVARVLKPGGRLTVSDVVADPDMDEASRASMQACTDCIAGALTETRVPRTVGGPGFKTSRSDRPTASTSRLHRDHHSAHALLLT